MDEQLKTIVSQWLIKADNDLKTAGHGLTADEPITDTICFHCQQAVEKYLKMYLVSKGNDPFITHNLSILVAKCADYDPAFNELQRFDFLTSYAVSLRYPDDFYMPEVEEAEEALTAARDARAFIVARIEI
ncbi:MAG: HEPN domain-containing protein [Desulfuromonadales bacterium]|nr:HEPN domain-containing protein [Desulfuromonadales bacterium]